MAGWLDDLLNGGQAIPSGLLAFLGAMGSPSPGAAQLGGPSPRKAKTAAEEDIYPPPMPGQPSRYIGPRPPEGPGLPPPVPGDPWLTIREPQGPPMPPEVQGPPMPPQAQGPMPFETGVPPSPYMFGGGLPPVAPPAPSAYFPPDAQGSVAIPPQRMPAPPAEQPNILGSIGRHILQGLRDNSNSLIAGGGAMISGGLGHGLSAMAQAAPLDIAARHERQGNEAVKATYNALIAAGHSPAEALAGSQNPEILKTLVAKPTWGVTSEDFMGGKQYGFIDPITRTVMAPRAAAGAASQSAGLSSTIPNGADGQPIHGQELLSYLEKNSPLAAEGVKAIIAGDINAGGRNLQKLLPLAHMVDPTMNQADYQSRLKTRVEFGPSGKAGREIKSANTAITHANDLVDLIPKLGNFTYLPWLNEPYNIARGQGSPDFQDIMGKYDAKSESLAVELSKAFNGGVTSDADRQAWRAKLDSAKSPVALNAVVQSAMKQLLGRVNANAESYNQGMGTAREGIHFIDKNNVPVFNRLMGDKPDAPAQTSEAPRAVPKEGDTASGPGGVRVILRGNKWVPIQ